MSNWLITGSMVASSRVSKSSHLLMYPGSNECTDGCFRRVPLPKNTQMHISATMAMVVSLLLSRPYRVELAGENIDWLLGFGAFFPTDSLGIVVLSNQNGSQVPGIVRNMVQIECWNFRWIFGRWRSSSDCWAQKAPGGKWTQGDSSKVSGDQNLRMPWSTTSANYENPGYWEAGNGIGKWHALCSQNQGLTQGFLSPHKHYDVFQPLFDLSRENKTWNGYFHSNSPQQATEMSREESGIEPGPRSDRVSKRTSKTLELSRMIWQNTRVPIYCRSSRSEDLYQRGKALCLSSAGTTRITSRFSSWKTTNSIKDLGRI